MSETEKEPKRRKPGILRPRLGTQDGNRNEIGERVKERRMELGLTQAELSRNLADATDGEWDPTIQQVLYIETKRRAVIDIEIRVLARVLKCGASWLLEGNDIDTRSDVRKAKLPAED
ncbi:MAG: helix-turn-helix domain-containing protein [Janthinobacterium lividum]